jgi:hypothetical protein
VPGEQQREHLGAQIVVVELLAIASGDPCAEHVVLRVASPASGDQAVDHAAQRPHGATVTDGGGQRPPIHALDREGDHPQEPRQHRVERFGDHVVVVAEGHAEHGLADDAQGRAVGRADHVDRTVGGQPPVDQRLGVPAYHRDPGLHRFLAPAWERELVDLPLRYLMP